MTAPDRSPRRQVRVDEATTSIIVEREFDAPRELVFECWSTCEHLRSWFGPAGWTLPVCEMDFRPGGRWRYGMRGPGDAVSHGLMVYGAIDVPSRIEYTDWFTDADGTIDEAMPVGRAVIEFHDLGEGRTRMRSITRYATRDDLATVLRLGAEAGAVETFDRLAAHLHARAA